MNNEKIKKIAVIGSGRMGLGIGQEIAAAGYDLIFHDINEDLVKQIKPQIEQNFQRLVQMGIMDEKLIQPSLDRITITSSLDEAGRDADLVIEAVIENLELKQEVFANLDEICPDHTIFASNTSTLMPSMIASATKRQDRFLIAHYFYPAYLMPLVEIVRSDQTSDESVNAVYEFMKIIGKKPIICQKEVPGFIANRLQIIFEREAFHMVQRGIATAQDVDNAVKYSFGRRMGFAGPFEILEHNEGYDMTVECERYLLPDMDTSDEPYPLILEMVKKGTIGLRSGKGFYDWTPEFTKAWEKGMEKNLVSYLKKTECD